jgi:hypothetical protein
MDDRTADRRPRHGEGIKTKAANIICAIGNALWQNIAFAVSERHALPSQLLTRQMGVEANC